MEVEGVQHGSPLPTLDSSHSSTCDCNINEISSPKKNTKRVLSPREGEQNGNLGTELIFIPYDFNNAKRRKTKKSTMEVIPEAPLLIEAKPSISTSPAIPPAPAFSISPALGTNVFAPNNQHKKKILTKEERERKKEQKLHEAEERRRIAEEKRLEKQLKEEEKRLKQEEKQRLLLEKQKQKEQEKLLKEDERQRKLVEKQLKEEEKLLEKQLKDEEKRFKQEEKLRLSIEKQIQKEREKLLKEDERERKLVERQLMNLELSGKKKSLKISKEEIKVKQKNGNKSITRYFKSPPFSIINFDDLSSTVSQIYSDISDNSLFLYKVIDIQTPIFNLHYQIIYSPYFKQLYKPLDDRSLFENQIMQAGNVESSFNALISKLKLRRQSKTFNYSHYSTHPSKLILNVHKSTKNFKFIHHCENEKPLVNGLYTQIVYHNYFTNFRSELRQNTKNIFIRGRKPFAIDPSLSYESDEDIEEDISLDEMEEEDDENGEGCEEDDGFIVPTGYLSDDEKMEGEEQNVFSLPSVLEENPILSIGLSYNMRSGMYYFIYYFEDCLLTN